MQGKLIIGAFLAVTFSVPAIAVEQPPRLTCSRGEQPQQAQQTRQRQQWAQQQSQQRNKPHGCPVNRMIPSVVDPTPTFLI
jgi:hypothetical protein